MKSNRSLNFEVNHTLISKLISDLLNEERFEHLNTERMGFIINKIASYGWYIDGFSKNPDINVKKCLRYIYSGFSNKLDEYLSKNYTDRLLEIEANLKLKHPSREQIINEAFYAHNQGLFYSSICLFITLVDGICDDVYQAKFFINNKKDHLPQIKDKIEDRMNFADFILTPVINKGPINSWEKELDKHPIRLNRHEIIHGIDVSYGTQINSLRFISMLSYIDFVTTYFKR